MKVGSAVIRRSVAKSSLIPLLACCLTFNSLPAFGESNVKEALRAFDAFYEKSLREYGVVGSSFMLIHDNQVLDRQFYGTAHVEEKRPVDENTIYHWASITKTFTGIAIMQLRDRGMLKLEDSVVKYLPELRDVHNPFGDISEITIRHLLSHTAGFRAGTWPWGGDKPWYPHEPRKWEQLVAMIPYTEILFKPGTKYSYSNPGIVFLGRIIEEITHDDYEVYIDKNIFKPLEMHRSYFDTTPYHLLKHRSHSYRIRDGKTTTARFDVDTGITVSNGGLNAPLTDMAKYLNFLMGDPKKQDVYDGVLKRSSLAQMWVPQGEVPGESKGGRERKDWVGLTFFIEENYGQRFIAHSGGQNAFITHFYLNPETRTAYLIAYNTYAVLPGTNPARSTDTLDREIKEYLFENVFTLFRK